MESLNMWENITNNHIDINKKEEKMQNKDTDRM